jgi:dihydrodipicolinate synthase/N-acetylneuraminate lyase
LFRHFRDVAQSRPAAYALQYSRTLRVDIQPETVLRLAEECSNIVSIKKRVEVWLG